MDKVLFERLTQSMSQMNEIIEGTREPSRTFHIDAMKIKEIRQASGLSQSKFAELISVNVDTLRNWEQGRRSPTGQPKRYFAPLPTTRETLYKHCVIEQ